MKKSHSKKFTKKTHLAKKLLSLAVGLFIALSAGYFWYTNYATPASINVASGVAICQGDPKCVATYNTSVTQKVSITDAEKIVKKKAEKKDEEEQSPTVPATQPTTGVAICQGDPKCIAIYNTSISQNITIAEAEKVVKQKEDEVVAQTADTCSTNGTPVTKGSWVSTGVGLNDDGSKCDGSACPQRQCVQCVGGSKQYEGSMTCKEVMTQGLPVVLPQSAGKEYTGLDKSVSTCFTKKNDIWIQIAIGQENDNNVCTPDGQMTEKAKVAEQMTPYCNSLKSGQEFRDGRCQDPVKKETPATPTTPTTPNTAGSTPAKDLTMQARLDVILARIKATGKCQETKIDLGIRIKCDPVTNEPEFIFCDGGKGKFDANGNCIINGVVNSDSNGSNKKVGQECPNDYLSCSGFCDKNSEGRFASKIVNGKIVCDVPPTVTQIPPESSTTVKGTTKNGYVCWSKDSNCESGYCAPGLLLSSCAERPANLPATAQDGGQVVNDPSKCPNNGEGAIQDTRITGASYICKNSDGSAFDPQQAISDSLSTNQKQDSNSSDSCLISCGDNSHCDRSGWFVWTWKCVPNVAPPTTTSSSNKITFPNGKVGVHANSPAECKYGDLAVKDPSFGDWLCPTEEQGKNNKVAEITLVNNTSEPFVPKVSFWNKSSNAGKVCTKYEDFWGRAFSADSCESYCPVGVGYSYQPSLGKTVCGGRDIGYEIEICKAAEKVGQASWDQKKLECVYN